MSPDIFPKYLKDPSLLYRISYEELKTLVVQYPYCQNLRYLLLVKSRLEGNTDQERNFKMAAAYSLDRKQLYQLLKLDLVEDQHDFEFLDLDHAITDEENPELELPILDFSNGIEGNPKSKDKTPTPLDLTHDFNSDIEDEIEEGTEEIDLEEDIIVSEGYGTDDDDSSDVIIDDASGLLIPAAIAPIIFDHNENEEASEDTEEKAETPSPLVPPLVNIRWIPEEESKTDDETEPIAVEDISVLNLPLVPPLLDIDWIQEKENEANETLEVGDSIQFDLPLIPPTPSLDFIPTEGIETNIEEETTPFHLALPLVPPLIHGLVPTETPSPEAILLTPFDDYSLVPPLVDIKFPLEIIEEVTETFVIKGSRINEENFAEEIDQSIQEALSRLAKDQLKELEQEEEEEIMEAIKREIQEEEIKLEDEGEDPDVSDNESMTDITGPMPKASFSSWLKQMESPTPSIHSRESSNPIPTLEKIKKKPKKKRNKNKKKKKKKKKEIKHEGDRLLKAIKARQKAQRKKQSEQMVVRKKKVMAFAEKSLKENEEIISETLAKILVIQGKKDKAEHMYRKLMLKFPKKSGFFAAEIKKIQNNS